MSGYPRAREGFLTEQVGDELLVYDGATHTGHALSTEACSVWRLCDGHSSAKEIARRVGLEQALVAQALDELSAAGLIEEPDRISRRDLHKRTAKLGAAALSAPLIYSIAIRPTSAHASANAMICAGTTCNYQARTNADDVKANADQQCATNSNCHPTSTCNCTPFLAGGGLWVCGGGCNF